MKYSFILSTFAGFPTRVDSVGDVGTSGQRRRERGQSRSRGGGARIGEIRFIKNPECSPVFPLSLRRPTAAAADDVHVQWYVIAQCGALGFNQKYHISLCTVYKGLLFSNLVSDGKQNYRKIKGLSLASLK